MKFYLTKDQQVGITFSSTNTSDWSLSPINVVVSDDIKAYWISPNLIPSEDNEVENERCSRLGEMLRNYSLSKLQSLETRNLARIWDLKLQIGSDPVTFITRVGLGGIFEGNILEGLLELSGGSASIKIHIMINGEAGGSSLEVSTAEMNIVKSSIVSSAICQDSINDLPYDQIRQHFNYSKNLQRNHACTITVTIPDEMLPHKVNQPKTSRASKARKILEEELFSDVILVARNQSRIRAHRSFLAAESSVFLAILQADMSESGESIVEIPDMAEESVRALLKYIYYGDLTSAEESSLVAFELFCAGHKYEIACLQQRMREFLNTKPGNWYDVDVGVKLFLFARNLTPVDNLLKIKAAEVLKTHAGKVKDSPTCQDLFKKDVTAAMELLEYAFTA